MGVSTGLVTCALVLVLCNVLRDGETTLARGIASNSELTGVCAEHCGEGTAVGGGTGLAENSGPRIDVACPEGVSRGSSSSSVGPASSPVAAPQRSSPSTRPVGGSETAEAGRGIAPTGLPRSYRQQVEEALARWMSPAEDAVPAAAHELLDLYIKISEDPTLSPREKRTLLRRLEVRLMRLRGDLRRQLAGSKSRPVAFDAADFGAASCSPQGSDTSGASSTSGSGSEGSNPLGQALPQGGPPGPPDYAAELIQLIERVVRPQSWASNGGRGEIFYWRPGQALVIRQTEEVHQEVAQLLELLRRVQ